MPDPAFLAGDCVSLHPVEADDHEFVQRNCNDPAVRHWLPRAHPQTRAETQAEFEERADDDSVSLLVRDSEGERLGFCALFRVNTDSGRAEVGIWLAPDAQRQGYATEALELLVEYAFTERRLHRLNAGALAINDRSQAMLGKLGFSEKGCRRDFYYVRGEYVDRVEFGLIESEWDWPSDED